MCLPQVIAALRNYLAGPAKYRKINRSVYTLLQQSRLVDGLVPLVSDWDPVRGEYGIRPHLTLDPQDRVITMDADLVYYVTSTLTGNRAFVHQHEFQMSCNGESIAQLQPLAGTIDLALSMIGPPGCNVSSTLYNHRCQCVIQWTWRTCDINMTATSTTVQGNLQLTTHPSAYSVLNNIQQSSSTSGQMRAGAFPVAVVMGDSHAPLSAFGCNANSMQVRGKSTFDLRPNVESTMIR